MDGHLRYSSAGASAVRRDRASRTDAELDVGADEVGFGMSETTTGAFNVNGDAGLYEGVANAEISVLAILAPRRERGGVGICAGIWMDGDA